VTTRGRFAPGLGTSGVAVVCLLFTVSAGRPGVAAAARQGEARALHATGDWGFSPRFIELALPRRPYTMPLRVECWSRSGCRGDRGFVFGPRDSNGHTIHFTGTTSLVRPMVDSSGRRVGTCTSDPAPSGQVTCRAVRSFAVRDRGWVGTADTITYTRFAPTSPGQPLAGDSWSDSPTGADAGNDPVNDMQLVLTPPVADRIEVFMNPTAEAFAAGQAPQSDEVGMICASEAFCNLRSGVRFVARLAPRGMVFPHRPGSSERRDGLDVAYRCSYGDTRQEPAGTSDEVTCASVGATVIDHYGSAVIDLPMKALPGTFPQTKDYRLTLSPGSGASGGGVYSDLAVVGPLRITGPRALPGARVDHSYRVVLSAAGGVPTPHGLGPPTLHHFFRVTGGRLPAGLALRRNVIEGTPVEAGRFPVTVRVADGMGDRATRRYVLTVKG